MVLFPNAKINFGLRITEKRDDGFHNIETVFLPIGLCDVLEFAETQRSETFLTITGMEVPGDPADNLVVRAWRLMNDKYRIPPVEIHLHKNIPMGAGLGGGSADAAFMLKGLDQRFKLGCAVDELEQMAAQLGSDCAFFIKNRPAYATGRGEILESITIHLMEYTVLLVNPGIHIGTREAYSGVLPAVPENSLKELIKNPMEEWQHNIENQFEETVFKNHPELLRLKEQLKQKGAVYTAMSGSGSTIYGIFNAYQMPEHDFGDYYTWSGNFLSVY